MVQLLLNAKRRPGLRALVAWAGIALLAAPAPASQKPRHLAPDPAPPELLLAGGRKLAWERSFDSESQVKPNRGFWNKLVDLVAGAPDFHSLVRPYSIAIDSRGRIIVTDPGARGVHVFDFAQQKYKFIQRQQKDKLPMLTPQCVAVDAEDNIYVTDSEAGMVFVFDSGGKFLHALGALRGGEGFFKRPTGIAVDSPAQRIYISDTLRNVVYILDMRGAVLRTIGQRGQAEGEFNFPTELRLDGPNLLVVDAMNFRVQAFDRAGEFKYSIGKVGDQAGGVFRPKAVGVDSEGDVYIVDALWGVVQVFNRQGDLLYYFGSSGGLPGQFQLPAGLFIDRDDRVFVVDSFNRRVQVFHYFGLKRPAGEGPK